nr:uncharacterized protein LOC109180941 [Ipomoea trifida]
MRQDFRSVSSLSREFGSRIDCRRWSNGWRRDGRTGGRRGCWSLEVAFWRLAVGECLDNECDLLWGISTPSPAGIVQFQDSVFIGIRRWRTVAGALQIPQRLYSLEELRLNGIETVSLLSPVDATLGSIERNLQIAALSGGVAAWNVLNLNPQQILFISLGLLFLLTFDSVSFNGGFGALILDTIGHTLSEKYHNRVIQLALKLEIKKSRNGLVWRRWVVWLIVPVAIKAKHVQLLFATMTLYPLTRRCLGWERLSGRCMVKQEAFTSIISCYVNGLIKRNWLHPFNIDTENLIKAGCKQIDLLRIKNVVSSSKEGLEIIYEVNKVPAVLFEVRKFTQGVDAARRAKAESTSLFELRPRKLLAILEAFFEPELRHIEHIVGSCGDFLGIAEGGSVKEQFTAMTAVSGVAWLAVECVTAVEVGAEGVFATKAVTAAHEAGHFLIAYLLGILPRGYTLTSLEALKKEGSLNVQAGTAFVDFEFLEEVGCILTVSILLVCIARSLGLSSTFSEVNKGQVSATMLNRFSCIALAGVATEYLLFGCAEGGLTDINQLDFLLQSLGFTQKKADSQVRWAVLNTILILRRHENARAKLAEGMSEGRSVGFCIDIIEKSISDDDDL